MSLRDAVCRTVEPEIFFNLKDRAGVARAKRLCAECPVRTECLTQCLEYEALGQDTQHGIFGGLEPEERARLRRRRTA